MREPYKLADRTMELLVRKATQRFETAKETAEALKFDELHVINANKQLYEELTQDNEKAFLELAQEQYRRTEPHGEDEPDRKWLLALLLAYNPVMKYVYENEVLRKRDRTTEAIIASSAKATEYRRGLSYWTQMTGWYADAMTDEATLEAYRDAGVRRVRWVTQIDGKECETCRERNGKVYPVGNIPIKPHPGCRCWFEPMDISGNTPVNHR